MDNNSKSKHHEESRHNQKENEFKTKHGNHSLGLLERVGDLSRFWLSRLSRSRGVGVKLPFIILLKLDMSSLDCLSKASFKDRVRSWVTESILASTCATFVEISVLSSFICDCMSAIATSKAEMRCPWFIICSSDTEDTFAAVTLLIPLAATELTEGDDDVTEGTSPGVLTLSTPLNFPATIMGGAFLIDSTMLIITSFPFTSNVECGGSFSAPTSKSLFGFFLSRRNPHPICDETPSRASLEMFRGKPCKTAGNSLPSQITR